MASLIILLNNPNLFWHECLISTNRIEHRESNTYSQITKHFLFLLLIKHSSTMDSAVMMAVIALTGAVAQVLNRSSRGISGANGLLWWHDSKRREEDSQDGSVPQRIMSSCGEWQIEIKGIQSGLLCVVNGAISPDRGAKSHMFFWFDFMSYRCQQRCRRLALFERV